MILVNKLESSYLYEKKVRAYKFIVGDYGTIGVVLQLNDQEQIQGFIGVVNGSQEQIDVMSVVNFGYPLTYEEAKGFFHSYKFTNAHYEQANK